jgi:hypothetical protein
MNRRLAPLNISSGHSRTVVCMLQYFKTDLSVLALAFTWGINSLECKSGTSALQTKLYACKQYIFLTSHLYLFLNLLRYLIEPVKRQATGCKILVWLSVGTRLSSPSCPDCLFMPLCYPLEVGGSTIGDKATGAWNCPFISKQYRS